MLRCSVVSDVHLEYHPTPNYAELAPLPESDTLIIAGDLGHPYDSKAKWNLHTLGFLKFLKTKFKHVVYVPGNHEYYQCHQLNKAMQEVDVTLAAMCESVGVVFLQCNSWMHPSGVKIVGCTLWSDICQDAVNRLCDFQRVFPSRQDYIQVHRDHSKWLQQQIQESKDPLLIVTHHLPSFKAIHPRFTNESINTAFASNLDPLFTNPVIGWISGHTHERVDLLINDIRLYVNPIGYPKEQRETTYNPKPTAFPSN